MLSCSSDVPHIERKLQTCLYLLLFINHTKVLIIILHSFSTGIWHRYDGAAYFPGAFSESVLSRLKGILGFGSITERLRQDAIAAAKEFLPSAEDIHKASLSLAANGQTMEGYLEKVVQVMSSLRFQMLDGNQLYVDETLVVKVGQINLCPSFLVPMLSLSACFCRSLAVCPLACLYLSVWLPQSLSLSDCLSFSTSLFLFVSLSLFVCLSFSLPLYFSLSISICLPVDVRLSASACVSTGICLCLSPLLIVDYRL